MDSSKANIIAQLQKEILPLQGFRTTPGKIDAAIGTSPIKNAFPNARFPVGAVHEFIAAGTGEAAVTSGFIAALIGPLMQHNGAAIWISASRTIFPPALSAFGISPDKVIFIDLRKEKEILWAMEEALKCKGVAAVIGELPELSFTASRRLQLAVEQSQVTGFVLRCNPRSVNTTACVTRWKITTLPSELMDGMPGVGFPRWNVELLKVRNGRPAAWQIEFVAGKLRHVTTAGNIVTREQKKAV